MPYGVIILPMPRSPKRSSYPAVTLLMTVLVGMWFLVFAGRKLIPPGPPNRLAVESSDFLQAGSTQSIPWWPIGPEGLAEAKRLNKPLLILVSATWSLSGREIDRVALNDRDVVERMRQDFVCVRIDLTERREWASAYLPVQRAVIGFEPSFQIWFLDPDLRVFASAYRESPLQRLDVAFMVTTLRGARQRWLDIQSGPASAVAPGAEQASDHALLTESPAVDRIEFDYEVESARRGASPFGGFPVHQFQAVKPSVWRFLLMRGETELLRMSLDPVLLTPIVDWLDGGFFRLANGEDWKRPEFDKIARQNAEMLALLAQVHARRQDPLYRYLIGTTYNALVNGFGHKGLIRGYRLGDEEDDGRSRRSSFSVPFLRGGMTESRFDRSQRIWLAENLNLSPDRSPLMVPYVSDRTTFDEQRGKLEEMLGLLRASKKDIVPTYGSDEILDINAFVAARILEAGRIIDDEEMIKEGLRLRAQVTRFRVGTNDVVRSIRGDMFSVRCLTDYIAYADAALQDYCVSGNGTELADGAAVLGRALELYTDSESGLLDMSFFDYIKPVPPNITGPQLCDDFIESSSAMAIRVLYQYSVLYRGKEVGSRFRDAASTMVHRLATAAVRMGTRSAGYYCAAWQFERDRAALTVGKDDLRLVKQLSALAPSTAIIAPLRGELCAEIAVRGAGVYILDKGKVTGPMSVDAAAERLISLVD